MEVGTLMQELNLIPNDTILLQYNTDTILPCNGTTTYRVSWTCMIHGCKIAATAEMEHLWNT